ncbi:MAG: hypothetical protein R2784_19085 [Saprospiraceae bacterium]
MMTIQDLVEDFKLDAMAVEMELLEEKRLRFVGKLIFRKPVEVFMVNEAGASIYSASEAARERISIKMLQYGAVSIARN